MQCKNYSHRTAETDDVKVLPLRQLMCRRYLSDRPRLVNQHAQTRHTTLSNIRFIRKFRIISVRRSLAHGKGSGCSYMSEREKLSVTIQIHGALILLSDLASMGGAVCLRETRVIAFSVVHGTAGADRTYERLSRESRFSKFPLFNSE